MRVNVLVCAAKVRNYLKQEIKRFWKIYFTRSRPINGCYKYINKERNQETRRACTIHVHSAKGGIQTQKQYCNTTNNFTGYQLFTSVHYNYCTYIYGVLSLILFYRTFNNNRGSKSVIRRKTMSTEMPYVIIVILNVCSVMIEF